MPPSLEALFVPLVTGRLALEPLAERHAEAMFAVLQDDLLYCYMPSEAPGSLAELRSRYRMLARGTSPDGALLWLNWILVRVTAGDAIGYVQATVPAGGVSALMGWTVGRAWQGCGFGQEAVRAVCRHLAAIGIDELRATIDSRNAASITVAESAGFWRERTFLSDDVIDGIRANDHTYVLRPGDAARSGQAP